MMPSLVRADAMPATERPLDKEEVDGREGTSGAATVGWLDEPIRAVGASEEAAFWMRREAKLLNQFGRARVHDALLSRGFRMKFSRRKTAQRLSGPPERLVSCRCFAHDQAPNTLGCS